MPEAAKLHALSSAPVIRENNRGRVQYQATPFPHLAQADSPAPTAVRQRVSGPHGLTRGRHSAFLAPMSGSVFQLAGMEYNWVEQGRKMAWIGVIGGLIVGVLLMYGVWLLVRSLK